MKPSRGGTKRSSWLTFRRRLILVRTLLRRPMSRDDLVAVVQHELGDEGYPSDTVSALKNDLDALKGEYGCQIRFHRHMNCYVLEDMGDLALLDLPDDCLEALSFLDASFPAGNNISAYASVRSLLDRIVKLLPRHRQREHAQGRHALSMQLPGASTHPLDPDTLGSAERLSSDANYRFSIAAIRTIRRIRTTVWLHTTSTLVPRAIPIWMQPCSMSHHATRQQ